MFVLVLVAALAQSIVLDEVAAFKAARASFEKFDYVAAEESFQDALVAPALVDSDRAAIWMWIGLCRAEQTRWDDVDAAFEAALVLDPAVLLPADTSPRIVMRFDAARARLQAAPVHAPPSKPVVDDEGAVPPLAWSAAAVGGLGVVALVGAAAAGGYGYALYRAAAETTNPVENARLGDESYAAQGVAYGAVGVAALCGVAAGVLAVVAFAFPGEPTPPPEAGAPAAAPVAAPPAGDGDAMPAGDAAPPPPAPVPPPTPAPPPPA